MVKNKVTSEHFSDPVWYVSGLKADSNNSHAWNRPAFTDPLTLNWVFHDKVKFTF